MTVFTKYISVPEFLKGAIFYQIFPDRFFCSREPKLNIPTDRIIHASWYDPPEYLPNSDGKILNNDYFGGDLKGIIEKLDYIKSLGVTIIYLNPIFEAHSNHRYNTADYLSVDPMLGTEEDFKRLCFEAKKRDMRIILDGVFNHTGSDSIYFNKEKRYSSIGAYNSPSSVYHSWYIFRSFPDEYESWWNFDTLPKLNGDSNDLVIFIERIVNKWLKLGASGFRLDVVDELTNKNLEKISKAIKSKTRYEERGAVIGEVWEDVSTKIAYGERKKYFTHNTLDSAMNYVYKNALFDFFETKNPQNLLDVIIRTIDNYPKDNLDSMMNIISGHDIERALSRLYLGHECFESRFWQADNDYISPCDYKKAKELLKLLVLIQYFLPGNPCIYYGDEVGVYGYKDPFNRKTFPWGYEDKDLLNYYRILGKIRTEKKYLKDASFSPIYAKDGVFAFERKELQGNKRLIIAVNISDNEYSISSILHAKIIFKNDKVQCTKLLKNGSIIIEL